MAGQFCVKHGTFRPCQECAKADIWQGESLIFKRDAEKQIKTLTEQLAEAKQDLENRKEVIKDYKGQAATSTKLMLSLEQKLAEAKGDAEKRLNAVLEKILQICEMSSAKYLRIDVRNAVKQAQGKE